MRYELRTTVRVSDEWLSVCAICLHTGLNPKGHQAAYALPNLFAAHDNEEPRYKGQRRFANRASRRCGGFLPVVLSGAIHLFKPLSPGAKTATTVSVSPGVKCTSAKLFAQKQAKTFAVCPRTVVSGRGSDAPCGEGSQKGDGEYRREQKAGPRKTSKPRLPKLKR